MEKIKIRVNKSKSKCTIDDRIQILPGQDNLLVKFGSSRDGEETSFSEKAEMGKGRIRRYASGILFGKNEKEAERMEKYKRQYNIPEGEE